MNVNSGIKKFVLGFLNPSLFGAYVLIAGVSGIVFVTCFFGYGCWYRVGGLLFLIFVPTVFVLLLTVILVGRLQIVIWKRLLKQTEINVNQIPLAEQFWRVCLVALIVPLVCANVGGKFPEARAQKICADCAPLIADLEKGKKLQGFYPTNAAELVKSNTVLRRRYLFYYGEQSTNGVDWLVGDLVKANISMFVTTNRLQCVIPIERISPVNFSSFYVYSYSSEHPAWNKVLLHWSLLGAYTDEP